MRQGNTPPSQEPPPDDRTPSQPQNVRDDRGEYHAPLDTLTGVLERLTYHNEENGYTVARLAIEDVRDLVTIVGSFSNPVVGEQLFLEGRWAAHREFGRQFAVERYNTTKPATAFAIEKYLGSGLIKGIGPVMAKRMVEKFGLDTLDVIEHECDKLLEVYGIGQKKIAQIQKAWHEQREIRNVMLFLQEKGVSATFAVKIYKTYGDKSLAVVEENPYRLAQDIWGIGFKTADKIAQQLGIAIDSERRLEAGLLYTLSEATDFGHLYLPEPKLLQSAEAILGVEVEKILPVLESMIAAQTVMSEDIPEIEMAGRPLRALYHPALYYTEIGLAAQLRRRLLLPLDRPLSREKIALWLAKQEQTHNIELSDEQREAVSLALENRIFVLTGGPGTGKTTITNLIARAFDAQKKKLLLVSPTGRAAKRLSEVTGREAQTIHRLLKFDPASRAFQYNDTNPLPCDVLIADEVSMLDAVLANNLLKAVPEHAQIVFVGDSDQLPSVGAGSVLGDMLASEVVPNIRLSQVFRQAQSSLIVTNAHRIRKGEMPQLVRPKERGDANCIWIEIEDSSDEAVSSALLGATKVVSLVRKTLPALGYQGDDIQVLAPMKRGSLGVDYLNELLQEALNPADPTGRRPELLRGSRRFRVGDRVIQLVNNYDKNVYNGDVGTIARIDPNEQILVVRFAETDVEYDFADYDELQLAYGLSIHKCVAEYERVAAVGKGLIEMKAVEAGDCVHTGQGQPQRVLAKIPTGRKPIVRLTTCTGFQIDVSVEHPLLTWKEGEHVFARADELVVGTLLCLSRQPLETTEDILLPPVRFAHQDGKSRWRDKENGRVCVPETMDEDLAWLLGAIVGDGSCRDRRDGTLDFTNQDPEVLERFRRIMTGYGLPVGTYQGKRNALRLYVISRPFRQWLAEIGLGYETARNKRVPERIFQASAPLRGAFLRGLFDTDGSAGTGNCRLCRLTTCSAALAKGVQTLLLSLGIVANRVPYGFGAYHIAISGTSLPLFHKSVGFTVGYKRERLNQILAKAASRRTKTNTDTLPQGAELARAIFHAFRDGMGSTRGRLGKGLFAQENLELGKTLYRVLRGQQRLSYAHLEEMAAFFQKNALTLPPAVEEARTRHYFYDSLTNVELLQEEAMMYDLEIENIHAFVANGFVCHNSQGSEYKAVVLVLHSSQYMMLQRNLLYTGLTRARHLCLLVGDKRAIFRAVKNDKTTRRYTRLAERLRDTDASLTPPDRLL